MALTIIAWGNSLSDMIADVAMTRKGFGEMAITGCIAGPIMNIMLGLGLSNTITLLKQEKSAFDPTNLITFSIYTESEIGE